MNRDPTTSDPIRMYVTDDTLDLTEAAALLRQHPHTVEAWAREGKIKAHRVGRIYLFLRSELIDHVREQPATRQACPSISEAEPTGSKSPAQDKRRLDSLLKQGTGKPRRNITTAAPQISGDSENSATVRELHSRQPLPTG